MSGYVYTAVRNNLVKGEWIIYYHGQLFCHLMDSDLIVFEELCERAGSPIYIKQEEGV